MKKLIALVLVLVMAISLAACAPSENKTETPAATNGEKAPTVKTVEEGKLIMATNAAFPPYEYLEDNEIVGIDVEIAKAIADKLGLELVVTDMEFDSIIESVKNGKSDIGLAGLTVTDERKEEVGYTERYATGD